MYGGVESETGVPRPRMVEIVVIVQYSRKSKGQRYDAGSGQTIGVINAFCKNQPANRCPAKSHPATSTTSMTRSRPTTPCAMWS